jgi:hypothetical protein
MIAALKNVQTWGDLTDQPTATQGASLERLAGDTPSMLQLRRFTLSTAATLQISGHIRCNHRYHLLREVSAETLSAKIGAAEGVSVAWSAHDLDAPCLSLLEYLP